MENVALRNPRLEKRLLCYTLAGGVLLSAPLAADAAIVHYGGPPVVFSQSSYSLDIDANGTTDFTFTAGVMGETARNTLDSGDATEGPVFAPDLIGPGTAFTSGPFLINEAGTKYFDFPGFETWVPEQRAGAYSFASPAYMGVRFMRASQVHYGWVYILPGYTVVAQNQIYGEISLLDWAWNDTPGQAIMPGATGVPEPSSLALFALGAAGIAAMKRRRKSASQDGPQD